MTSFSYRTLVTMWVVVGCAINGLLLASRSTADGLPPSIVWQSPLSQDHPLVGQFVTRDAHRLRYPALLQRLRQAPLLLIGEKHDNPDHHQLQARLLRDLVDRNTAVVFEMLDDRHAPILSALSAGDDASSLTLDGLQRSLQWSETGWRWRDYGPLFLQVLQQGGALIAGNLERSLMMGVYVDGLASLGQDTLQPGGRFGTVRPLKAELSAPLLDLVFESHCGKMPRAKLQPMLLIQLARDASMAFALQKAQASRRILIAGAVHARQDVGVPRHLSGDSLTLLMVEVQADKLRPTDYAAVADGQADIVWFSPRFTDEDYCSRL